MSATVWQRTQEWEPDPTQPRDQLISIALDVAKNGESILLVTDEQTGTLITGAATRSNYDINDAVDTIAAQLAYAIKANLEARAKPQSRLLNRGPGRLR